MDQSKKKKTTQVDSQKDTRSKSSGLVYWDDYDFAVEYLENQNATVSKKIILNYDHDNPSSSNL